MLLFLYFFLIFFSDCNIQISSMNECMILSDRMLPMFADSTLARDTLKHKLPNMYPISPTIDLLPFPELQFQDKDMGGLLTQYLTLSQTTNIRLFQTERV